MRKGRRQVPRSLSSGNNHDLTRIQHRLRLRPYLLVGSVSRCDALRARRGGGLPGGGGALLAEANGLRLSPPRRRIDSIELPPARSTDSSALAELAPAKCATGFSRLRELDAAGDKSLVLPALYPVVDTVAITLPTPVCCAPRRRS